MTTDVAPQGERSIGRRCRGDAKVQTYDPTTRRWSSCVATVEGVIREAHGSSRGAWTFLVEVDDGRVLSLRGDSHNFRLMPAAEAVEA